MAEKHGKKWQALQKEQEAEVTHQDHKHKGETVNWRWLGNFKSQSLP